MRENIKKKADLLVARRILFGSKAPKTTDDILRVAAEAPCSPTTVRRYLDEGPDAVTQRSREKIEAAIRKLKVKL